MSKPWLLLLPVTALLPACVEPDDVTDDTSALLGEGSREAFGVLTFLNGPAATFDVLDREVDLDRRAAQNIADHVRTDRLDTVAELDAIAYVGPAAMDKLLAYVAGHGGVPDYLVEGVPFSGAEADAVLAAANGASQGDLDGTARLDARAAAGIVAARPIADLDHLATVSYVGPTALARLKAFAATWTGGGPTCTSLAITGRAEPEAQAWTTMLEEATWGDFGPFGRVYALQATCADTTSTAGKAALLAAIQPLVATGWQWSGAPVSVGAWNPGGAAFNNLYDWTLDAVDSRIESGRWTPDSTWARRDEIHAALVGPAVAAPASFLEITLRTNAEECSEHAAVRVDTRDGAILVVQIAPRC